MSLHNIDEIMETYQNLVDANIITLEEGQDMFDDNINDLILETKKEIDEAFDSNIITAYEKNICYVNIGLDIKEGYDDVITNLIESEMQLMYDDSISLIEEKKSIDLKNIPTKEEFYKKQMEKQAKKEKRKNLFKKVGKTALAAGVIAGGAYIANKAEKAGNAKKVVRADNAEYSDYFDTRDRKLADAANKRDAAIKRAKTDVEKDDINNQYKAIARSINAQFNKDIYDHNERKKQHYAQMKAKDDEEYNKAIQSTNDPARLAEYKRRHKEIADSYDIDKENRRKARAFGRSDALRDAELNREDPENMHPAKRFLFGVHKQEKKMDNIKKNYSDYNKKNIR